MELRPQGRQARGCRRAAEDGGCHIARQQLRRPEDDERNQKQRQQAEQHPAQQHGAETAAGNPLP
jgi:hypothetical protein